MITFFKDVTSRSRTNFSGETAAFLAGVSWYSPLRELQIILTEWEHL